MPPWSSPCCHRLDPPHSLPLSFTPLSWLSVALLSSTCPSSSSALSSLLILSNFAELSLLLLSSCRGGDVYVGSEGAAAAVIWGEHLTLECLWANMSSRSCESKTNLALLESMEEKRYLTLLLIGSLITLLWNMIISDDLGTITWQPVYTWLLSGYQLMELEFRRFQENRGEGSKE